MTIQDWGVTYDELEPYYDKFEYLCGTSGKAGNIKGRSRTAAIRSRGPLARLSDAAAEAAIRSDAVRAGRAGDGLQPVPAAFRQSLAGLHESARRHARPVHLLRLLRMVRLRQLLEGQSADHDPAGAGATPEFRGAHAVRGVAHQSRQIGKRATGVTYVDTSGEEWEQPADLVLLCAFQLFNVHLLLHSGIGTPYDPSTGEGVIGRNYSYQVTSSVDAFFDDKNFNPFIASGAIGMCIDEFNGDNFDHGPHGFVGGGYMGAVQTNGRPIQTARTPQGTPRWGAEWKKAVAENYLSSYEVVTHGSCYSYRDVYLDLDPTYTDRFGRKLMRITFDFHENELKMSHIPDRPAGRDRAEDGTAAARQASAHAAITTSPSTRRRTPAAARSWAPIPRPARSTAICRAGTCPTCSSPAPRPFRRMPATIRPTRLARSPIGRRTRS